MSVLPPAQVRRAAAHATLSFDWLVPAKPWFTPREVGNLVGMSDCFIEKLLDEGRQIAGHEYNGGAGKKFSKRVPRAFVINLLIKSARYDAETKLEAFLSCLREFSQQELLVIAEAARKHAFTSSRS